MVGLDRKSSRILIICFSLVYVTVFNGNCAQAKFAGRFKENTYKEKTYSVVDKASNFATRLKKSVVKKTTSMYSKLKKWLKSIVKYGRKLKGNAVCRVRNFRMRESTNVCGCCFEPYGQEDLCTCSGCDKTFHKKCLIKNWEMATDMMAEESDDYFDNWRDAKKCKDEGDLNGAVKHWVQRCPCIGCRYFYNFPMKLR